MRDSKATTIDLGRFGIMWHGGGMSNTNARRSPSDGGTRIRTGPLQDKANGVALNLDGPHSARVTSGTGTIVQLMESDDPGGLSTTSVHTDPVYGNPGATATRNTSWDLTDTSSGNKPATLNLTDMTIKGNYYNAVYNTVPKNMVMNLGARRSRGSSPPVPQRTRCRRSPTTTARVTRTSGK